MPLLISALSSFLLSLFRILALGILLYFLACILYLVNRYRRVPSLRALLRVMHAGLKGFPGIARHRLSLAPRRIKEVLRHRGRKHIVHPAYPHGYIPERKNRKKRGRR